MGYLLKSRKKPTWSAQRSHKSLLVVLAWTVACTLSAFVASAQAQGSSVNPAPLRIETVELSEAPSYVDLDVVASNPLVWTSYWDAEGHLVVELPNSAPQANVVALAPAAGLVSAVHIDLEEGAWQPITRLTVETRRDVEHSLEAEGNRLRLRLRPIADGPVPSTEAESYEPLPAAEIADELPDEPGEMAGEAEPMLAELSMGEGEPVARQAEQPTAPAADANSDAKPEVDRVVAEGVAGTVLEGVEVASTLGGTTIRVMGDGPFTYESFELDNPARFVLDLTGVVNASRASTVAVDTNTVRRVRIAQFQPFPEPISRVVFDLADGASPVVRMSDEGLLVSFGGGAQTALGAPSMEPEPAAMVAEAEPAESQPLEDSMAAERLDELDAVPMPTEETSVAMVVSGAEMEPAPMAEDQPMADGELADGELAEDVRAEESLAEALGEPLADDTAEIAIVTPLDAQGEPIDETFIVTTDADALMEEPRVEVVEIADPAMAEEEPMVPEVVVAEMVAEEPAYDESAYEEPAYDDPTYDDPTYDAPVSVDVASAETGLDYELPPLPEIAPEDSAGLVIAGSDLPSGEVTSDVALFEAADVQFQEPVEVIDSATTDVSAQVVGTGGRVYSGRPITMSLKDADIKDVLRSFSGITGLNVVVHPGVKGSVTVELRDVPWDQALDLILKINNLDYVLEGNIMRIATAQQLQNEAEARRKLAAARASEVPLQTVIRAISYAEANQIARLLTTGVGGGRGRSRAIMSSRGSITVDRRTNKLIIKELPGNMSTVLAIIDNLDTAEPQVLIEARIVETTKSFSRTLGINWGFNAVADDQFGNTSGLAFPHRGNANGGVNLLTGGNNGFLDISLGNILDTFTLDLSLQAAENEGLVSILSAPKIATLNNQRATIQSGLQIPIQTVANNTVSVQFVNATLQLEVTPQVTAEGTVMMDINLAKREPQLAFAIAGAANAPISTKQARTRVIVRDGGTTVIGGIYEVSNNRGQDRVPGLANIPILGHLFKNRRRNIDNEELLIFITPRVIQL